MRYRVSYDKCPSHSVICPDKYEEVLPDDLTKTAAEVIRFKFSI